MSIELKRQTLEGAKGVIAEEMSREYAAARFKKIVVPGDLATFPRSTFVAEAADWYDDFEARLLLLKVFAWQVSHAKTWKALAAATDTPAARQFGWQVDAKGRSCIRSEQEHVPGCSCGAPWCSELIAAQRGVTLSR